jgi:hypothetical protein
LNAGALRGILASLEGGPMDKKTRWLYAAAIVLIDWLMVIVPLSGLLAAYILVARPPWFKQMVDELYRGS